MRRGDDFAIGVTVIGIDCATVDERTGVAVGLWTDGNLEIRTGRRCGRGVRAEEVVSRACERAVGPILLALDAPLGWPVPLSDSLRGHRAGEPLAAEPSAMFSRETDRFIRAQLGKKPLEVGADRIARTALKP